ncbi:MAG: LysM peptidoglycan-binding domain-containing protein [Oscillospiraceae bacterium]|nr:LysM peptidoglycan-binding domain-containing protein [Oscillospiraceae bacterium]
MGYTAKQLIAIAEAEIGYHEKASNANLDSATANSGSNNYTKYARDLYNAGYYNGNKQGYAWCDVFVDWLFFKLTDNKTTAEAMECQTGTLGAGCSYSKQYYKTAGRLYTSPKEGDQIFFKSGISIVHTGIVKKASGSRVYTIEGNTSDAVAEHDYALTDSYIDSYGRPKYDEDADEETTATSSSGTTSGSSDDVVYTVVKGDTLSSIAAKYGTTYKVLAEYNSISNPNLITVGQKIKIPSSVASSDSLAVGDKVKMSSDAVVYGTSGKFSSWVYSAVLYVRQISGSRVVVSISKTGAVTGAVDKKYLTKT